MNNVVDVAGTPKTLDEAIIRAIMIAGPIGEVTYLVHLYVQNFLAERFNVAYFEAKRADELQRLQKLFRECTDRA